MYRSVLKPFAITSAFVILIARGVAAPATDAAATNIDWIKCPTPDVANLRCANFSVPLDWSQPKGEHTTLGLSMVPAKNQSKKIGPLFFNSGGPGGTASPELKIPGGTGLFGFTDEIYDNFDMIAMDPRGIATSSPIQCSSDIYNERISQFPEDEAFFYEIAKDFEAVRQAVGAEKFNYIGLSYGTVIGTAYAELFPDKIRAMALDGNVDHTQEQAYTGLTEMRTYEKVLTLFFAWCENNSSCAMHPSHTNSMQSIASLWDALIDRADKSSIRAPNCTPPCRPNVTGEEILFNAQIMLLFKDPLPGFPPYHSFPASDSLGFDWPTLGDALYAAIIENDASGFSTTLVLDDQNESITYAFVAVYCQDWNVTARTLPELLNLQQLTRSVAPHTRGASEIWRATVQCIAWPAPVQYPQHSTRITNTPPILLVNAYYDPETSYDWAVALQSEIEHSTLLTRNGAGHTSYALRGETSDAINEYLLTLKMPPPNTIYIT